MPPLPASSLQQIDRRETNYKTIIGERAISALSPEMIVGGRPIYSP